MGYTHPYPTVNVSVNIEEQPHLLTVRVVEKLPVPNLLSWNLPVLLDFLLQSRLAEVASWERGKVKDLILTLP